MVIPKKVGLLAFLLVMTLISSGIVNAENGIISEINNATVRCTNSADELLCDMFNTSSVDFTTKWASISQGSYTSDNVMMSEAYTGSTADLIRSQVTTLNGRDASGFTCEWKYTETGVDTAYVDFGNLTTYEGTINNLHTTTGYKFNNVNCGEASNQQNKNATFTVHVYDGGKYEVNCVIDTIRKSTITGNHTFLNKTNMLLKSFAWNSQTTKFWYVSCYNGNYTDAPYLASTDTTSPTYSNLQNNGSTTTLVDGNVSFGVNILDETNLSSYIISDNLTGSWINDTVVFNTVNSITINTSKLVINTYNQYSCWIVYFNDSLNNKNSTVESCFNVANTLPTITINYPNDGYSDSLNLSVNFTYFDLDSQTGICNLLTNTTTINNFTVRNTSTSIISGNSVNLSVNNMDTEGTYGWRVNCSDSVNSVDKSNRTFNLDLSNPTITFNNPVANNNIFGKDSNITVNVDVTDNHLVYACQTNITNSTSNIYTNLTSNINLSSYTINSNISLPRNDNYLINVTCSDAHTKKIISNYSIIKDIVKMELGYTTESNTIITVKIKNSTIPLDGFGTYKVDDRYNFWYDFSQTTIKNNISRDFIVKISSNKKLNYINNNLFSGWFVAGEGLGDNWIDMKLCNGEAAYLVKNVGQENNYEVTINTVETNLSFCSIGGLNVISVFGNYTLDNTSPTVAYSTNTPSDGALLTARLVIINLSYTEIHNDTFIITFDDVNYTGSQITSSNAYFYRNFNNIDDGVHTFSAYINDSAGQISRVVQRTIEVIVSSISGGGSGGSSPTIQFTDINTATDDYVHLSNTKPSMGDKVYFTVSLYAPNGIEDVRLYYRRQGNVDFIDQKMQYIEGTDKFETSLGPYKEQTIIEYYVIATYSGASIQTPTEPATLIWSDQMVSIASPNITNYKNTVQAWITTKIPAFFAQIPYLLHSINPFKGPEVIQPLTITETTNIPGIPVIIPQKRTPNVDMDLVVKYILLGSIVPLVLYFIPVTRGFVLLALKELLNPWIPIIIFVALLLWWFGGGF